MNSREGRDALLGSSAVANQEHHRPAVERERGQFFLPDSEIQYYTELAQCGSQSNWIAYAVELNCDVKLSEKRENWL